MNTFPENVWVRLPNGRQRLVPKGESMPRVRKNDAHNIVSEFSACAKKQMPEFNRRFGHLGVKYVEKDGTCVAVYKDRNSRLAVLKARGLVDFDEIRG